MYIWLFKPGENLQMQPHQKGIFCRQKAPATEQLENDHGTGTGKNRTCVHQNKGSSIDSQPTSLWEQFPGTTFLVSKISKIWAGLVSGLSKSATPYIYWPLPGFKYLYNKIFFGRMTANFCQRMVRSHARYGRGSSHVWCGWFLHHEQGNMLQSGRFSLFICDFSANLSIKMLHLRTFLKFGNPFFCRFWNQSSRNLLNFLMISFKSKISNLWKSILWKIFLQTLPNIIQHHPTLNQTFSESCSAFHSLP